MNEEVCNSLPHFTQLLSFLLLICKSFVPQGNQQIFYPWLTYTFEYSWQFSLHKRLQFLCYKHIVFLLIFLFIALCSFLVCFCLKIVKHFPVFFCHFMVSFFLTFNYFLHLKFIYYKYLDTDPTILFPKELVGCLSSVQFSRSVVSDSLRPHELQHARPPCPSPTPGVHSNSCPSSR